MIKTLETDRIILRRFAKEDLDDFFNYAKNPNVGPAAGWRPHRTKEDTEKILKLFIEGNEVWAIELKETGQVIGSVGLHQDITRTAPKAKSLGFVLAEEYWGQGLMTEAVQRIIRYAFEELELALLSVAHYPFNHRSKRVVEKCGFHYEGTLRYSTLIFDGTIYDTLVYSLLQEEWLEKQKGERA